MDTQPLSQRGFALMWIPQGLAGVGMLIFGLWLGAPHIDLMRHGARASGRIVDFKHVTWWTSTGSSMKTTAALPIVEFPLAGRMIRFDDWLGGRAAEFQGATVPVLYRADHPSTAMIDRPLWNWMPWGFAEAIGALLTLAALSGFARFLSRHSST
jgi:hypothetical protein